MNNTTLIQKVIDAFDEADVSAISALMDDNIIWEMVGDRIISSKKEMEQFLREMEGIKTINSKIDYLIVEGDSAAVSGRSDMQMPGEPLQQLRFADFYTLKDGKVSKIISFPISIRK